MTPEIDSKRQPSIERENSNSSDSTEKLERKTKIKNLYKCCGTDIDRRIIQGCVQVVVILTTLLFSMYMACTLPIEDSTVWISIISALAGNHMPNYLNNQNKEN